MDDAKDADLVLTVINLKIDEIAAVDSTANFAAMHHARDRRTPRMGAE